MLPLTTHEKPFVRANALRALKGLRILKRCSALLPAGPEPEVRMQAVGVLGYLQMEEALHALILAGRDPDIEVHGAAVGALAFSNSSTVSEALIKAISDEAWRVREMAAETIGKLKSHRR